MENIVAHSLEKLYREFEKADQSFLDSGMKDMDAHERLSCAAETVVLAKAVKSSYSRTSKTLGKEAEITQTAVMSKVHGVQAEIPFEKPAEKKHIEYLYIEADEDLIHKQEKKPLKKKSRMIGKLLYLYEGREEKGGRWKLPHVFYLGGLYPGSEENHRLFQRMQEYIETNYETQCLKKVYINGDCGS